MKHIYAELKEKATSTEAQYVAKMRDSLQDLYDKWSEGVIKASENAGAAKENTTHEGDVKYQLDNIPSSFEENIEIVANMDPVAKLNGDEFAKGPKNLISQVTDYYKSIGNKVKTEYGDVGLARGGVKSSIAHGIGRNKAIAFKAVPSVLSNGKMVDYQTKWKGRGYDTAVICAPLSIQGTDYYMAVVVKSAHDKNSYYLHEVLLQQNKGDSSVFKTGSLAHASPSTQLSPIYSILQRVQNSNTSEIKKSMPGEYFDVDLFDDDISDEQLMAKHFERTKDDIGEVLKNVADIEITPARAKQIAGKVLKEYNLDSETINSLSVKLRLALYNFINKSTWNNKMSFIRKRKLFRYFFAYSDHNRLYNSLRELSIFILLTLFSPEKLNSYRL